MIPISLQPEPAGFDKNVRKKGLRWLKRNSIGPNEIPPKDPALPAYWSASNKDLWEAYNGLCAYLSIYIEWTTGASSTDHYFAKSKSRAGDAYEWKNYRLSALGPNRNKNNFDDVLDPAALRPHTFFIEFSLGMILPNPTLPGPAMKAARDTIERLNLDSAEHREMRSRHFQDYLTGDVSLDYLRRNSPFVYEEILRQGLK